MWRLVSVAVLGLVLSWTTSISGGDKKDDKEALLTLVDEAGNEIKLKNWKMVQGAKVPPWLAKEVKIDPKTKKPVGAEGPQYLELREDKSPMYKEDLSTWLALESVKQLDYDHAKKSVLITALGSDGKDHTFKCPTDFLLINKFHVDGEVEKVQMAPGSKLLLRDGQLLVKSIRFPTPKAAPEVKGRAGTVIVKDNAKTKHAVIDLLPLYQTKTGYRQDPLLMFQKTVKIDLSKIEKMVNIPSKAAKGVSYDFEVFQSDGSKQGLTLLKETTIDSKDVTLVGLLGKTPAGFKLFPASVIQELTLEKEKKE